MIVYIWGSGSIFEKFFCEFWLTQIEGAVQRMVTAAFSAVKVISLGEFIQSNYKYHIQMRYIITDALYLNFRFRNQDLKVTWAIGSIAVLNNQAKLDI